MPDASYAHQHVMAWNGIHSKYLQFTYVHKLKKSALAFFWFRRCGLTIQLFFFLCTDHLFTYSNRNSILWFMPLTSAQCVCVFGIKCSLKHHPKWCNLSSGTQCNSHISFENQLIKSLFVCGWNRQSNHLMLTYMLETTALDLVHLEDQFLSTSILDHI